MALDPTIRQVNVAVLLKLESSENVDAGPDPAVDAIPVEVDSISYNSPWTTEASNEANGSYVAGAPLIIGQAATISFKSRVKGAGAGAVYSSSVKPPLHAAFQSCGWRGLFTAAIGGAGGTALVAVTSGSGTVTLANAFPSADLALVGMQLQIAGGAGAGAMLGVSGYTGSTRIAKVTDKGLGLLDTTSLARLPASWSYQQTSPADATARATDMPSTTIYIYRDGTLLKFTGCRGTLGLDGKNARPGYATFSMTGTYAGKVDASMPSNIVVAGHVAPVLAQGSAIAAAALLNRNPVPISTWSLDAGSQIEVPENPNTPYGFDAGQIVDRASVLTLDPLSTLVATRDTISDIGAGTTMSAILRHGTAQGNTWSLLCPFAQPTDLDQGNRGKLLSDTIKLQCRNAGKDATGRDNDRTLFFW